MARKTLTDRTLETLKPAEQGKRYDLWDSVVPGLGVRVTDAIRKDEKGRERAKSATFVLVARFPGSSNPTRRALGGVGALTLADAREKARNWLEDVSHGIDPKETEDRARRAEQRRRETTFKGVAEDFIAAHLADKRTGERVARDLKREFVTRWGSRAVTDISRSEVIAAIKDVADRRGKPAMARNLLTSLKVLFDWAIEQDVYGLDASPCDRIRPVRLIGAKVARERVLDHGEIKRVWDAAGEAEYPFGPLVKLLLLTAQRRSEVGGARWSEFDLDEALWTIPPERTKTSAAQIVPLAPTAIDILRELPRFTRGDFVFTTTAGERPVSGFAKMKERLDSKIAKDGGEPMSPWVLHDLRRTARTEFSAIPALDLVRELALGHVQRGVRKNYDRFAYLDEKRALFEAWAARVRDIVTPPPDNVARIDTARGAA